MTGQANILHADLDSFYASVEQRDDPRLRGKPVIVGMGVVLAASYEAKAHGVRTAMGGRMAQRLCPQAIVVPPRMSAYSEASKAVFEIFRDTTPLVEGISIDEAFLDVRGMQRIAGTPEEIAVRLRRRVLAEVGLPITVGVARTKHLAKVASAVAKPDGLLVVPPGGELAFLHPLPVERIWGVGPGDRPQAARARADDGGRRRAAQRGVARDDPRPRGRAAPARARAQPRPAAGARRPAATIDGRAAGARAAAALVDGARLDRRRPRRPAGAADADGAARLPHGDPADALRRLLARDPVAHACPRRPTGRRRSSPRRASCWSARAPLIEAEGLTLVGLTLTNLSDNGAIQLALPVEEPRANALDAALDDVRDRFGSASITRAVLVGRDPGLSVPLLPD